MVDKRIIFPCDIDYYPPYPRGSEFVAVDVCDEIYGCLKTRRFYISRGVADDVIDEFVERNRPLDNFEVFRHIRLLNTFDGEAVLTEVVTHPQMRRDIAKSLFYNYSLAKLH